MASKPEQKIYEALIACVHSNIADDEYLPTMTYIIHKLTWEITASNETADKVVALITAGEPVTVDDKEIEEDEHSLNAELEDDA